MQGAGSGSGTGPAALSSLGAVVGGGGDLEPLLCKGGQLCASAGSLLAGGPAGIVLEVVAPRWRWERETALQGWMECVGGGGGSRGVPS